MGDRSESNRDAERSEQLLCRAQLLCSRYYDADLSHDLETLAEYYTNSYTSWFPVVSLAERSKRPDASGEPCATHLSILRRYLGAVIATNTTDPFKFEATWLTFVRVDYFSVKPISPKLPIHYPTRAILSLREWPTTVPYSIHRPVDLTLKQGALDKLFTGKIEDRQPQFGKVELTTPCAIEIHHNVIPSSRGRAGAGVGVAIPIE